METGFLILAVLIQQVYSSSIYYVTIHTGSDTSAGTNANVYMRLFGNSGKSDLIKIPGNFQQSSVETLKVDFKKDVGDPVSIKIGHDNSGPDANWMLEKVIVKDSATTATFIVRKWLENNSLSSTTYVDAHKQAQGNCGSIAAKSRVVNGASSQPNQWPWQVAINYLMSRYANDCGGTLIHPQYVLTAAHCFQRSQIPTQYRFKLGEHDLTKAEISEQEINAVEIIQHPKWNGTTLDNDIALVKLRRPAMLNDKVKLACLPKQGKSPNSDAKCIISGWGRLGGKGPAPTTLMHAELPIVSNTVCEKRMHLPSSPNVLVTKNMLCGGGNFKSGCHGDSGGPYVCRYNAGRYVVEGIVSWGHPDCLIYPYYTVFARVSEYTNWIESKIYSSYIDQSSA